NFNSGNRGFTLLELLVALTIFALISVALFGSLTSMIETKQHLEADSNKLRELQTAFRIIGRDIEQAIARPVRAPYQEPLKPLVWTEHPANLELTTNGRRNPVMMKRSSLQRVAYRLEDDLFIKDTWPVLDRAIDSEPFSQVLLRDVESFEVSFVGANGPWHPVNNAFGASPPASVQNDLPKAVKIILYLKNWGRIDRLFVIG
ncbi:MAG: type II secretion system minor pseudopilin GspJ, partial [Desulfobulbaceae bacterium]|nr:type II secretion system minor pseudopilin GspJ [Desulfobulbaceae bacterium]